MYVYQRSKGRNGIAVIIGPYNYLGRIKAPSAVLLVFEWQFNLDFEQQVENLFMAILLILRILLEEC